MSIEIFKGEIDRGFRVLGYIIGELDNEQAIQGWKECGYINENEAAELRAYNRKVARGRG